MLLTANLWGLLCFQLSAETMSVLAKGREIISVIFLIGPSPHISKSDEKSYQALPRYLILQRKEPGDRTKSTKHHQR